MRPTITDQEAVKLYDQTCSLLSLRKQIDESLMDEMISVPDEVKVLVVESCINRCKITLTHIIENYVYERLLTTAHAL
jgi:hypothetical protein